MLMKSNSSEFRLISSYDSYYLKIIGLKTRVATVDSKRLRLHQFRIRFELIWEIQPSHFKLLLYRRRFDRNEIIIREVKSNRGIYGLDRPFKDWSTTSGPRNRDKCLSHKSYFDWIVVCWRIKIWGMPWALFQYRWSSLHLWLRCRSSGFDLR